MTQTVEPPVRPLPPVTEARGRLVSLAVAAAVLVIDQATKSWVHHALADGHTVHVLWTLRFNLSYNSGMAFSRGRGLGPLLGVVALLVVAGLLATMRTRGSRAAAVGVGLVIGGALGNVTDRLVRSGNGLLRGSVIDFIDLQWWPIFNLADAAIVVGGLVLGLRSLRQ
jgi:signal peptidase II